jgi:hexulose-6-phosphate isomerase
LGAGDVDWKAVMAAFKKVGYNGYITAEMLPYRDGQLRETSQDMDRIMGR